MENSEVIEKIDKSIKIMELRIRTAQDKDLEGLCQGLKYLVEARIKMEE